MYKFNSKRQETPQESIALSESIQSNESALLSDDEDDVLEIILEAKKETSMHPPGNKNVETGFKRKHHSLLQSEQESIETPSKKLKSDEINNISLQREMFNHIENEENLNNTHEESESLMKQHINHEEKEINFVLGEFLQVKDMKSNKWYTAKIIKVIKETKEIKIHYYGWNDRFDRDFPMNSDALRSLSNEDKENLIKDVKKGKRSKAALTKLKENNSAKKL